MKKVIWALLAIAMLPSCAKDNPVSDIDSGVPITIHLGIGGDISVSSYPITKGAADYGIYGINVYFDKEKDGNTNDIYAFGVFDNVESMTITLLSGYKYTFQCTMVKNGQDKLYFGQYGGNAYSGYAKPFQTSKSSSSQVSNSFKYTNNSGGEYLTGIKSGIAIIENSSGAASGDVSHPKLNRYYGELQNYSPVDGGIATIPLKKTCFGVKLIIKGVPEGTLSATVKLKNDGYVLASNSTGTSDYTGKALNYSFKNLYDYYVASDDLPAFGVVSWEFKSSLFSQWDLSGSNEITIKRNVLTTITVSVTPDSASGAISLTEEEWHGDNNEINMGINTDGLIDIIVNPDTED